jgi:hypothetical protein
MSTVSVSSNFPVPKLSTIATHQTPPTYATIRVAQKELNSNAAAVHSHGGGGRHGLLALTVTPAAYLTIAGVPFIPPPVPPLQPVILPNARATQIAEAHRQHADDQRTFQQYHDTDKALVKLLLEALPRTYVEELEDDNIGFANVTCLQLLTYLYDAYGSISLADRDNNQQRMMKPWSPPSPITDLFRQIQDGLTFAAAAGEPINDSQASRMAYNNINATGMFVEACREWRLRDAANQTFAELQTFFRRMERDRQQSLTSASEGFVAIVQQQHEKQQHQTNQSQSTPQPITPTTCAAVQNTTTTSKRQADDHTIVTELRELINEIKSLKQSFTTHQPNHNSQQRASKKQRKHTPSYCWTHGCTSNPQHNSKSCNKRAQGHCETATYNNRQGGSNNTFFLQQTH